MEVSKIKYRILTIIFIIALILPIVMIIAAEIKVSLAINDTKNILNNLDADEVQQEILVELKNSNFNINSSDIQTKFETLNKVDSNTWNACSSSRKSSYDNDFVYAFIVNTKEKTGLAIPLFKIESTSHGKFKKITYINEYTWFNSYIISNSINKVLDKHGIKGGAYAYHGRRYSNTYCQYSVNGNSAYLQYKDSDFAIEVLQKIDKATDNYYYKNIITKSSNLNAWGFVN